MLERIGHRLERRKHPWIPAAAGAALILLVPITQFTGCSSGGGGGDGWVTQGDVSIYWFDSTIRIGDDLDYNEMHPDHFVIDAAVSDFYSKKFSVPSTYYTQAVIVGEVAGSSQPDRLQLNGRTVGTLPRGNNSAQTTRAFAYDVTGYLVTGENTLEIRLALYPDDDVTPLDDIEIYNLRIEMRK